jgi:penicillin amidase
VDELHRFHRFRARAQATLKRMPKEHAAILQRYADGVNAGLEALQVRPFEYGMLRTAPQGWSAEDSLLVVWAMYFDLQGYLETREFARGWLRDNTTPEQLAVLLPEGSDYDVPLDTIATSAPPWFVRAPWPQHGPAWFGHPASVPLSSESLGSTVGSSQWALAGSRTAHGGALLANDMHLGLRLPHIWYRARFIFDEAPGILRRVAGVTLPGVPFMIVGSNEHVAWGFTNSYGDYLDLVELQRDPSDKLRLRTPHGWERARVHDEVLQVKSGAPRTISVIETSLGPVREVDGKAFAVHWVAHDEGAVNANLWKIELADDLEAALEVASATGMPAQNMLVADARGHIGWTIAGPLPMRTASATESFPFKASEPLGWRELRPGNQYPRVVDPASGQLSTANNRQLAGDDYAKIGDGGPDLGARARQVHDDLSALRQADEAAVAAIALDDRALFIAGWRKRALEVLDEAALEGNPSRAEFKRVLLENWSGRASTDSAGYTLARTFMYALYAELFGAYADQLNRMQGGGKQLDHASFDAGNPRWPAVIERMLDQLPQGWLPPGRTWRGVQLDAIDRSIRDLTGKNGKLVDATWGRRNATVLAHPFAKLVPGLDSWLASPAVEIPGDEDMPRVAGPRFGQSERLVVSPGREAQAMFSMPGGQSGHPLSDYFLAGHAQWARGEAGPLLPGAMQHQLRFVPVKH